METPEGLEAIPPASCISLCDHHTLDQTSMSNENLIRMANPPPCAPRKPGLIVPFDAMRAAAPEDSQALPLPQHQVRDRRIVLSHMADRGDSSNPQRHIYL